MTATPRPLSGTVSRWGGADRWVVNVSYGGGVVECYTEATATKTAQIINSHDALVAALEEVETMFDMEGRDVPSVASALSLARGESG